MNTRTANNEAASGENAGPGRGPWVLVDGKRLQFRDILWKSDRKSLDVLEIIDRALVVSPEDRNTRGLWLQTVLVPVQQAWALKLANALDSLEPGLSERLPMIASQRIKETSYCRESPFPSVLDKPELLAMACAYLYWRDDSERKPIPWSTLNKVCGVKAVQLAQHLHSAVGLIPCPVCGQQAEAKIVKRAFADKAKQRPDGELICGTCGHTESLAVGNPTEREMASQLSCGCSACIAKTDVLRTELRASLPGLAARIAAIATDLSESVQAMARNFNASPLIPENVYNATNAITYAPRHGSLVNIDRFNRDDDWHRDSDPVEISLSDLGGFLATCQGGADLKVEQFIDISDPERLATWCLALPKKATLSDLVTVPDEQDAFREWIRMARHTGVLIGFIPVPITIEMTLRERPAPRQPSPMDSAAALVSPPPLARSVRQQPDLSTRIADAIALLKASGYAVVHRRNLE